MRTKILLEILIKNGKTTSKNFLAEKMNLSITSIRNLIRDVNYIGDSNGFQVKLIKGSGYYLSIVDKEKFEKYMKQQNQFEVDVYNSEHRLKLLMFYIFQIEGYFTFEQIAEKLKISRTTIVRDFKKVDEMLKKLGLCLDKKAHFGLRIVGSEQSYRRAFSEFVLSSDFYLEPTQEFYEFDKSLNIDDLKTLLSEELSEEGMKIADLALENVLNHIKVLIFRVKKHNYITNNLDTEILDDVFNGIAKKIAIWIRKRFSIELPKSEISFLAAQIAGKSSIGDLAEDDKKELLYEIEFILKQIDSEFSTDLYNDKELKDALILHMFPLLSRMYNNVLLENTLIDEVYREYANTFLLAFRFSELIEKKYEFKLSIDEVGYLALHFAAHFERQKSKMLEKYKRIVVICSTGGGSSHLLRLKLESIFNKAIIVTVSANELYKFKFELPDLFLTTIPVKIDFDNVPIIYIKQWLDESEIRRIKKILSLSIEKKL